MKNLPIKKIKIILSLIFFLSGASALIYQVAWQRLLTLYYGVGSISITLIVSVYMFGLGFGALLGGYLAEKVKKKVFLYFIVELLIGCFGLVSLPFLDYLGKTTAGSSYVLSLFYMFLYLSIPTLLMGMTLPILTKIFNEIINNFLHTVSLLYFINTIGAAIGALLGSYIFISFYGLDGAVYIAIVINFILAFTLFFISSRMWHQSMEAKISRAVLINNSTVIGKREAYLFVFITGFLAIGYEIVWFRMIGILVKDSPYAFSSILFVYLVGIALGSFGMKMLLDRYNTINKRALFLALQFFIGLFVIGTFTGYYYLTKYTFLESFTKTSFFTELHPPFIISDITSIKGFLKDLYAHLDIFFWPILFVFIPTLFMGASFPLISSLALSDPTKEGKTVGNVYFFNILGNVLGGIVTGFVLLTYIGTEITILAFSMVGMGFGIFIPSRKNNPHIYINKFVPLLLIISFLTISPKRNKIYEIMHSPPHKVFKTFIEEGRDGVIVTYEKNGRIWNYINGTLHGIRPVYMFFYEVVEAMTYAKNMNNVLIIGYGAGSTTEAVLRSDQVKNVTIVEINRDLIKNLKKIPFFRDMLADERVKLVIDDGRRFLLRTEEKFDLILIDPLRSTTAYSNNLYSKEFYEIVKKHLSQGGVFMVWMDEYKVMPKTVIESFDYYKIYSVFSLASNVPFIENKERKKEFLTKLTLEENIAIEKWDEREDTFLFNSSDLALYPINRDTKPVAEYYIGLRLKEVFFKNH
ncbi:MAG: fused MFS/spermidine synthase [Candidatus Nitrosocaldus sp.]